MSGRHANSYRDSDPGSDRGPTGRRKKRSARVPLIILGAVSLIGLTTIVVKAVSADAEGCSSTGLRLTVVADPSIEPVVRDIGAKWSATRPQVGDDCVRVEVVSQASYELANSLGTWAGTAIDVAAKPAPTPADADLPVVWIPDSSYWLGRVRGVDRDMFDSDPTSIASSPVVLAMPETKARELESSLAHGVDAAKVGQLALSGVVKLGAVEPRRDSAGMVGAMMLSDALVASEKDLPKLVAAFRGMGKAADTSEDLWKSLTAKTVTAAPVSEQQVLAYNSGNTAAPVAAITLADMPTLDFPYAIRAKQARPLVLAANEFRAALTSPQYRGVYAEHGLRSPDGTAYSGFPTGHGVTTATVHVQPLSDMAKVRNALGVWVAAKTPSRVVAMVDATQSMNQTMTGGGNTRVRIDVMRSAAQYGLTLFTDDSQVGLYAFAGPGAQPLVPLGSLDKIQRQKLLGAMDKADPVPTDVCPLYKSLIQGYKQLLDGYDEARSNTLVIFTDGRDNTGYEMKALQKELEKLADITRPVRVVLLGIGPDVDLDALKAIADTTGGVAVQVTDPDQIEEIFLKALLA